MNAKDYADEVFKGFSEKQWQAWVVARAKEEGFLVYHTFDSRRSQPGFPDLTMAKPGRLIFAELKTEKGRVTPDQRWWLENLTATRSAEVYVWRPLDHATVQTCLRRPAPDPRVAVSSPIR